MKKNAQRVIVLILIMTCGFISMAQEQEKVEKEKTQVKISANYNTNINYYGRTDSLRSSSFFPMIELWLKETFYINAAPVFVNNKLAAFEYAGTVATAGVQFNAENKWLGNIYVLKPFYKESSELVQSVLNAQAGATFSWLNKIINITAGADAKFSDKTDFGVTGGLDHIVRLQLNEKSVLVINPSAYLNAGTQQFTKSYLQKTPGFLIFPGSEQLVSESAEKFNILSWEFSVPVILAAGKMQVTFTPAYVIPQNLVTVQGRPDLSERGKKMFYATIGVKKSF